MPSAKQIKARKAFAKKYAKKGKRKAKSKKPFKPRHSLTARLAGQQREPTRAEFKRAGYSQSEIDDYFDRKWDKKMQEFLNKSNNES